MKPLALLAALLAAAPAVAHDGAHVHPHGAEAFVALSLVIAAAVGLAFRKSP